MSVLVVTVTTLSKPLLLKQWQIKRRFLDWKSRILFWSPKFK